MIKSISQQPSQLESYSLDWGANDLETGETIASSVFTADSSDYTISNTSNTGTTTTFFITGGIPGKVYYITNTITTSSSRTLPAVVAFICIPQNLITS